MDLLAHPFQLRPSGTVATVPDGTTAADAQGLAVLALTVKGERDERPNYGVPDPVFDALSAADLNVGLLDHGPDVTVVSVTTTNPTADTELVEVSFIRDHELAES